MAGSERFWLSLGSTMSLLPKREPRERVLALFASVWRQAAQAAQTHAIAGMFLQRHFFAHGSLQALQDLFRGAQVVQMFWAHLLRVEDRAPDPLL